MDILNISAHFNVTSTLHLLVLVTRVYLFQLLNLIFFNHLFSFHFFLRAIYILQPLHNNKYPWYSHSEGGADGTPFRASISCSSALD